MNGSSPKSMGHSSAWPRGRTESVSGVGGRSGSSASLQNRWLDCACFAWTLLPRRIEADGTAGTHFAESSIQQVAREGSVLVHPLRVSGCRRLPAGRSLGGSVSWGNPPPVDVRARIPELGCSGNGTGLGEPAPRHALAGFRWDVGASACRFSPSPASLRRSVVKKCIAGSTGKRRSRSPVSCRSRLRQSLPQSGSPTSSPRSSRGRVRPVLQNSVCSPTRSTCWISQSSSRPSLWEGFRCFEGGRRAISLPR